MIKMKDENSAIDKQACVCVRLNHNIVQVEAIARARRWRGLVKRKFVNSYLHYRYRYLQGTV